MLIFWHLPTGSLCTFIPGDGVGGVETELAKAGSKEECEANVLESFPDANGATWRHRGDDDGSSNRNRCFAEFNMTGTDSNPMYITCKLLGRSGKKGTRSMGDNGLTCLLLYAEHFVALVQLVRLDPVGANSAFLSFCCSNCGRPQGPARLYHGHSVRLVPRRLRPR